MLVPMYIRTVVQFRGVIVTASGAGKPGGFDFLSRYFGPWNLGLANAEDPVTGDSCCAKLRTDSGAGSAHTVLAPYWGAQLGMTTMRGWDCGAGAASVYLRSAAVLTAWWRCWGGAGG